MALHSRSNPSNYFATLSGIDSAIGAQIDAELNALTSTVNSLDNANIDGTPKIDVTKVDLTTGGYVLKAGDTMTGILQHLYDTVSSQNIWHIGRATGNARLYTGMGSGLWCVSYNTYYTGAAWSGRDVTGIAFAIQLETDGLHIYYEASQTNGTVPTWTEVFQASETGAITNNTGALTVGLVTATDLTVTASAASPPDTNTLVKDNIIKGWINLDGTGTIAINDSYNVSGIVDNGTGDYTITWNTDFANTNYCVVGMSNCTDQAPVNFNVVALDSDAVSSMAVGSVGILVFSEANSAIDSDNVFVMAIGDQ